MKGPVILLGMALFLFTGSLQAQTVLLTEQDYELRMGPGTEFQQIGVVSRGTNIKVLNTSGDWWRIELPGGRRGWINMRSTVAPATDEALRAQGLCYEIERTVNSLANFTTTKCLPGRGDQKDSVGFIIVSEKPVFSVEAAKKAWLIVVIASVGRSMNDNPRVQVSDVVVSDVQMMKNGKALAVPGALAKMLQRKVHAGEIDLESFYRQINASLRNYTPAR